MTDAPRAPITYLNAQATVLSGVAALRTAGVAGTKLSPAYLGRLIDNLQLVSDLLGMHAERQAARCR